MAAEVFGTGAQVDSRHGARSGRHVVADSDLHVMEPPDLWQRYIDPAFAHAAPIGLTELPATCGSG